MSTSSFAISSTRAVVFGLLLFASSPAAAETPALPAVGAPSPDWDGSQMRSNHAAREVGRATRPPVQGASGYGAMAAGTATPTRHAVPRTLEETTQREWQQGPLARSRRKSGRLVAPTPTSPRAVSAGINRGSSLRSGSRSARRR